MRVGYAKTCQHGDHLRMTATANGEHHVTVPLHNPVKVGTLSGILTAVAAHLEIDRAELIRRMRL
ncbi:MAG: hypothetical protein ABSH20_08170 [Tepidisphaeraceae bacterium]